MGVEDVVEPAKNGIRSITMSPGGFFWCGVKEDLIPHLQFVEMCPSYGTCNTPYLISQSHQDPWRPLWLIDAPPYLKQDEVFRMSESEMILSGSC